MKPITEIVAALRDIPGAMVPPDPNPRRPPVLPGRVEAGSERLTIVVDLPDDWDYPDWVERERWEPLDRDVSGEPALNLRPVGIEALAWYVSFHQSEGGEWGIFIPVSSLGYFEVRVLDDLRASRARKWQLAYDALLAHEQMHFAVDYVCAQWELLLRTPCWAALHERMRAGSTSYLSAEEQLANAFKLRCAAAWKSRPLERALHDFVASQPPGYRDALSAVEQEAFDGLAAEVTKHYVSLHAVERGLNVSTAAYDYAGAFPLRPDLAQCPIHVIHDEQSVGLPASAVRLIKRMCRISESEHFQRRLNKLDRFLQRRWTVMKQKLSVDVPRSARLEKITGASGDVFSVRLNDNFRVHLRMEGPDLWQAVNVGSHREMGHG